MIHDSVLAADVRHAIDLAVRNRGEVMLATEYAVTAGILVCARIDGTALALWVDGAVELPGLGTPRPVGPRRLDWRWAARQSLGEAVPDDERGAIALHDASPIGGDEVGLVITPHLPSVPGRRAWHARAFDTAPATPAPLGVAVSDPWELALAFERDSSARDLSRRYDIVPLDHPEGRTAVDLGGATARIDGEWWTISPQGRVSVEVDGKALRADERALLRAGSSVRIGDKLGRVTIGGETKNRWRGWLAVMDHSFAYSLAP